MDVDETLLSETNPGDDPMDIPATLAPSAIRTNLVEPKEPVLTGVRLYVGKVNDPNSARMIAAELGADIVWDIGNNVTHMLWEGKLDVSRDVRMARECRIPIVSPHWILESRKHMKRAVEGQFPTEMDPINSLAMDFVPSATTVKPQPRSIANVSVSAASLMPPPAPQPSRRSAPPPINIAAKFLDEDEDLHHDRDRLDSPTISDIRTGQIHAPMTQSRDVQPLDNAPVRGPSPPLPDMASQAAPLPSASQSNLPARLAVSTQAPALESSSQGKPVAQAALATRSSSPMKPLVIQHEVDRQDEKKRKIEEDRKKFNSLLRLIPDLADGQIEQAGLGADPQRQRYELAHEPASDVAAKASSPKPRVSVAAVTGSPSTVPASPGVPAAVSSHDRVAGAHKDDVDDGFVPSSQYVDPASQGASSTHHEMTAAQSGVIGYRRSEGESASAAASSKLRSRNVSGLIDDLARPVAAGMEETNGAHHPQLAADVPVSGASGVPNSNFGTGQSGRTGMDQLAAPSISPIAAKARATPSAPRSKSATPAVPKTPGAKQTKQRFIIGLSGFAADAKDKLFQERQDLISAIERLGGTFSNCLGDGLTHLVAKDMPRSPKVISSLAFGRWIITPKWILESNIKGRFLPELDYEWNGSMVTVPAQLEAAAACRPCRKRKEEMQSPSLSLFGALTVACYFRERVETNVSMLASCGLQLLHEEVTPAAKGAPAIYSTLPKSFHPRELHQMGCKLFFTDRSATADPKMTELMRPENQYLVSVVTTSYISDFLLKHENVDPAKYFPGGAR